MGGDFTRRLNDDRFGDQGKSKTDGQEWDLEIKRTYSFEMGETATRYGLAQSDGTGGRLKECVCNKIR